MSDTFNIEIISPEQKILSDKISSITFPAFEGEMTILSNHIPIITFLRPGLINITGSKNLKYFAEEGTIEFSNNNLSLLSSTITEIKNFSSEKISKMIEEIKQQLSKEDMDDKTRYILNHKMDSLSKINL